MTEQQRVFTLNDGLPTKPDVDALLKKWPELKVGDELTYEQIGAVIGAPYGTRRFETVQKSWVRRLLEKGIVLKRKPGESFYVATAAQVFADTYGTLRHVGRSVRQQRKRIISTMRADDSEDDKRARLHHSRILHAVEAEAKAQRKELPQLPQMESHPQRKLLEK